MCKNIVSVLLLPLFLFACSADKDIHYDYLDFDNTIGLVVEPSNKLQFQDKNLGDVLKFTLRFSPEELTLLGIDVDSASYGSAFENSPPFNHNDCLMEVGNSGYCSVNIKMLTTAKEGDSGSIRLMFSYNLDTNENTVNKIKYHTLSFEYKNSPNMNEQANSDGTTN